MLDSENQVSQLKLPTNHISNVFDQWKSTLHFQGMPLLSISLDIDILASFHMTFVHRDVTLNFSTHMSDSENQVSQLKLPTNHISNVFDQWKSTLHFQGVAVPYFVFL